MMSNPVEVEVNAPADADRAASSEENDVVIGVRDLGKCYRVYKSPRDRLKQALWRGKKCFFREFWALRGVSLDVRRGETVGVIGRNGCGKSTLLQLVCGTLSPSIGGVDVNGKVAALLELGAGFNPEFSGRDNIYTNGAVLGLSRAEIDARFDDIVEFSELGEFIDQPVKVYSSGMYVRLGFAVAASIEPDILVVDEALAVGDEAFQRKCFARIERIKARGGTILFVSHSVGLVVQLCDRAVLLDHGELLLDGHPKKVAEAYHKLLYCRPDLVKSVRSEIQSSQAAAETPDGASEPAANAVEEAAEEARFDPALKPKNSVIYDQCGAEITDPRITTVGGKRVNVLIPHREYEVRYRVRFTKPAYRVVWGTQFKTIPGVGVTGMVEPRTPEEHAPAGCEVEVAFRFLCALMPGVYFGNLGVHGIVDGREGYLHRIIDGLVFRVLLGYDRSTTGGAADLFIDHRIVFQNSIGGEAA